MKKYQMQLRKALELHQQGLLLEANTIYRKLIKKDRRDFYALYLSGLVAHDLSRFDEAEELLMGARNINSNVKETYYWLGRTYLGLGNHVDATTFFEKALQFDSENVDALFWLGSLFLEEQKYDDACKKLEMAIILNPSYAEAYAQHGIALRAQDRYFLAKMEFEKAIRIKPKFPAAYLNYGIVFQLEGSHADSISYFEKALSFKHDYAEAYCNLGIAHEKLMLLDRAMENYNKAIKINPSFATAFANRGNVLQRLMRFEDAKSDYFSALSINKEHVQVLKNLSHLLLLNGEFKEGFEKFEWRSHREVSIGGRTFEKPLWLGIEPLNGKKILIHDEQGFGDVIQFCRYVDLVNSKGAKVIFAVRPKLIRLISNAFTEIMICSTEAIPDDFDFHCPLMSLPFALKTDLNSVPNKVPYLSADPCLVSRWKNRIGANGFKIGICWQGSTGHVDEGRSFHLRHFERIASIPGVRLISLHKGEGEAQINELPEGMIIETLGEDFDAGPDSFMDAAAVVHCCDLIITSDTAIAHLAGAMAIDTWIVLQNLPDWRWMLYRNDSPWYPTLKLFRQSTQGDWDELFTRIKDALLEVARDI